MQRFSRRQAVMPAGIDPSCVAPGDRLALLLNGDDEAIDRQLDGLCDCWHRQPWRTAYVDARAPFLGNLSMFENFWLPLAQQQRLKPAEALARAQPWLETLGWSQADWQRLLRCRPGDLPPLILGRCVLLRAAMAQPDWLLLAPSWFEYPLLRQAQLLPLMDTMLGVCRWLLVWPAALAALPPGVAWHRIHGEPDV